MHWGSRTALAAGVLATLGLGLGGCGSAGHSVHGLSTRGGSGASRESLKPMPVSEGPALSSRAPASLVRGVLAQPGATQGVDAGGALLSVTLRGVIDPLRSSGAELPPGTRAVGVIIQIRSSGPKLYDSSATGDVGVVVSSGLVTPVLATRGVCKTPLDDFDRYITAGEDRIGCVVFAVADGATLDAVRFSPHARRPGRLTWAP
jgi:hypothetical protein